MANDVPLNHGLILLRITISPEFLQHPKFEKEFPSVQWVGGKCQCFAVVCALLTSLAIFLMLEVSLLGCSSCSLDTKFLGFENFQCKP